MQKLIRTLHISLKLLFIMPAIIVGNETTIDASNESLCEKDRDDLLKLSEAFGHFIGSNLQNPGIQFDLEHFIKGIREGAAGKPAPISDQEFETLMESLQEKALAAIAEENLKDANAFLEDNLDSVDVFEIVRGRLQYEILKPGTGPQVVENGTPLVHLLGKLLDGTVIITTEATGNPIELPLEQTIPGLQKGIAKMREGEKRRLYIHPEYGAGASDDLPPNTVLIVDVEVIKANVSNPEEIGLQENEDLSLDSDEDEFYESQENLLPPW